jgi:hypothetical protein
MMKDSMGRLEEKTKEYNRIMDERKGPRPSGLTGTVDPFHCSVERMMDEVDILERLAKSWDLSFCPCHIGAGTLSGGLYFAHDAAGNIKALVHPERFHTTIAEQTLNFWSFQIDNGFETAKKNGVPFVVIIQLDDGLYSLNFKEAPVDVVHRRAIGQRIAKRREFEDVVSAVDYIHTKHFKSLRRKAE